MSRAKLLPTVVMIVTAVAASTASGHARATEARSQSARGQDRPLPPPVQVRAEPEVALEDPAFEPLPGARADFGRLGGAVYQIEVPDNWNGQLVLDMHGYGELGPEARVGPPDFRHYLIAHGIAWGASSFSSTSLIPGRAADETAAVWDQFAHTYGRPSQSYITGWSMGGAATHIAAERYADRFDGALAFCGAASQTPALSIGTNFFVAAGYAAGVTQADYDASTDVRGLIHDRIMPALDDPQVHKRFEDIMVELTGGPRRFARPGIREEEQTNWRRAELLISAGLASNRDVDYRLGPGSPVSSDEFNRSVIRLPTNDEARRAFLEGNETTGDLQMPMLTLHTTGDGQVPIEQARILRQRVDAAGKGDLLVQRVVGDVGHCGFTTTEMEAGLEALKAWVERGTKPKGTNVLVGDLRQLNRTFELSPRPGTPQADGVRGAGQRVSIRGNLTVDGAPLDARFLGAVVEGGRLAAPCQYALSDATDGRYEITVMGAAEASGCGRKGTRVVLWTYVDNKKVFSNESLRWPTNRRTVSFDASFSTAKPEGATRPRVELAGEVYDGRGRHLPAGVRVDAYVRSTRCGVGSVRRTGSFSGYLLAVAGPESVAECAHGATLTFRVNGRPAVETAINAPGRRDLLDLTLR